MPPFPEIDEGCFREVKTGVLLLLAKRLQPASGRRSIVRGFLVTCLEDADEICNGVWAQFQELAWPGAKTVVVSNGAERIWNRAEMHSLHWENLDFSHAIEHAWEFAHLRYGEDLKQVDHWVHQIAKQLRAGGMITRCNTSVKHYAG
jgi:hypothetical protein